MQLAHSKVPAIAWAATANPRRISVSMWFYRAFELAIHRPARGVTDSRHGWRERSVPAAARMGAALRLIAGISLIGQLCAGAEVDGSRWRWSNPLPHGNNVLDLLVTPDFAVQVGDGGSVYVLGADDRWAPLPTGVTNYLRGVALMGSRLIVVGENGCVLFSNDGRSFHRASLSPAPTDGDWFEGVAASPQRAVAVGDNGMIYTSTDVTNWSRANSGTTQWLRGVAFGSGSFVAVGETGTILRSTSTASSWSKINSGTTADLNRVRYLGNGSSGQFYLAGDNGTAGVSANGSTWTSLSSGTVNTLNDVALNDTGLMLAGDQELRYRPAGSTVWTNYISDAITNGPPAWTYLCASGTSNRWFVAGRTGLMVEGVQTNGSTAYVWTPVADSSHAWLWDITVQRGICVAAGDLATILTSLDGILWAREVVPLPRTNVVLLGVGGSTNLLLAAGNNGNLLISRASLTNMWVTNYAGTNIIVTNTTFDTFGVVWTNLPAFTTNTLQGVGFDSGKFVVCGDRGAIFTSTDGSNFVAQSTLTTNFLSSVAAGGAAWVATGARGTALHAGPEAESWSAVSLNTTNWIYRVRYVGDIFVAVGQNGALYTSTNGTSWIGRTSGTTRWLNDVCFADGVWYVAGNQGLLLASADLANWAVLPVPTIKSLSSAAVHDGRLLLAGVEGVVLRNPVLPSLSPVNILGYQQSIATNIVALNQTNTASIPVLYELFLFGGLPDQQFQFQSQTNAAGLMWKTNATFELFDPSGTLYLIRDRDLTNTPPAEFYRTRLN